MNKQPGLKEDPGVHSVLPSLTPGQFTRNQSGSSILRSNQYGPTSTIEANDHVDTPGVPFLRHPIASRNNSGSLMQNVFSRSSSFQPAMLAQPVMSRTSSFGLSGGSTNTSTSTTLHTANTSNTFLSMDPSILDKNTSLNLNQFPMEQNTSSTMYNVYNLHPNFTNTTNANQHNNNQMSNTSVSPQYPRIQQTQPKTSPTSLSLHPQQVTASVKPSSLPLALRKLTASNSITSDSILVNNTNIYNNNNNTSNTISNNINNNINNHNNNNSGNTSSSTFLQFKAHELMLKDQDQSLPIDHNTNNMTSSHTIPSATRSRRVQYNTQHMNANVYNTAPKHIHQVQQHVMPPMSSPQGKDLYLDPSSMEYQASLDQGRVVFKTTDQFQWAKLDLSHKYIKIVEQNIQEATKKAAVTFSVEEALIKDPPSVDQDNKLRRDGASNYTPEEKSMRIQRWRDKLHLISNVKLKPKYRKRMEFAAQRVRVGGRFVKQTNGVADAAANKKKSKKKRKRDDDEDGPYG